MATAQKKAKAEHKMILLNFSGSDWCIPCIKMHNDFFASEAFNHFADSSLVLVNADFPRTKKKQLAKDAQQKNDALAAQYNTAGKFPLTVLLAPDGKAIRSWEGYNNGSDLQLLAEIRQECRKQGF